MVDNELATDEELWALRYSLRRDLVDYARRQQYIRMGGTSLATSHIFPRRTHNWVCPQIRNLQTGTIGVPAFRKIISSLYEYTAPAANHLRR